MVVSCRFLRRLVVALAIGLLLAVGVGVGPATGQAPADPAPLEVDTEETAATVDRIRERLYLIAAGTGALLVVYIWHTNPRRRFLAHERRREARELAALDALEEVFVLPGELVDEDPRREADGRGAAD